MLLIQEYDISDYSKRGNSLKNSRRNNSTLIMTLQNQLMIKKLKYITNEGKYICLVMMLIGLESTKTT